MARIARVVIPGIPHHITQRGNRQQKVFFRDEDYLYYRDIIAEGCKKAGMEIWAYCLMPNHIHLIAVPPEKDSLRAGLADAHRRFARRMNLREELTGHVWQDRFASFPMDEEHTLAAARYIEMNPVAANMVKHPQDYRWSSAKAHLSGQDDALVTVKPMLDWIGSGVRGWAELLDGAVEEKMLQSFTLHETTGRPLGNRDFLTQMEKKTGRALAPAKRGPKSSKTGG